MTTNSSPETTQTLSQFFEMIDQENKLYPFFQAVYENQPAFVNNTLLEETGLSIEYTGLDLTYPMLDAIVFGIHWEQHTPSTGRDPAPPHFDTPRDLPTMHAVVDAQPDPQYEAFFRAHTTWIESPSEEDLSPPEINYRGLDVSIALRNAIVFGRELEAWNARNLDENPAHQLPF